MFPLSESKKFAEEWIKSWNKQDLDLILSHYADEIEFTSPFVIKLMDEPSGTIRGKEKLKSYFQKGLSSYPELRFELFEVLTGVNSLVVYYRSVNNLLAAEIMVLNHEGKIAQVFAHYNNV